MRSEAKLLLSTKTEVGLEMMTKGKTKLILLTTAFLANFATAVSILGIKLWK
jgi:hypothetical protein